MLLPPRRGERGSFLNHYEGKNRYRRIHISYKDIGASFLYIEKGPDLYAGTMSGPVQTLRSITGSKILSKNHPFCPDSPSVRNTKHFISDSLMTSEEVHGYGSIQNWQIHS